MPGSHTSVVEYSAQNERFEFYGIPEREEQQRKGYAGEAAAAVRDWAFANTDYPALYSYCKYTNIGSCKTAESIGMHLLKEYPDPENVITRVSVILRAEYSSGR